MRRILLAIAVIYGACAYGQQLRFASYNVEQGLPQSSVWSIAEDRDGFLWVGTSDGLCRFDGYTFTVYKRNDADSASIWGNSTHRCRTDSKGKLWIAHDNGLSWFDSHTGRFNNIVAMPNESGGDIYNNILGIDDADNIWVGISGVGLVCVAPATAKVDTYNSGQYAAFKTNKYWTGGAIMGNGKLYIATQEYGVHVLNLKNKRHEKALEQYDIGILKKENDSILWASEEHMLLRYNVHTGVCTQVRAKELQGLGFIYDALYRPAEKEMWFAGINGIVVLDAGNGNVKYSIKSFDPEKTETYNYAHTLYSDRSGNIWVGTNGDGLKKICLPHKRFRTYSNIHARGNLVKAVYADKEYVYAGCYNNGFDVYHRSKGFIRKYDHANTAIFPGSNVYAVNRLDSIYLIVHFGTELLLFNTRLQQFVKPDGAIYKVYDRAYTETNNYPFLYKAADNSLYTDCYDRLHRIVPRGNGKCSMELVRTFAGEMLNVCFEDNRHGLWVGTMRGYWYRGPNDTTWRKGNMTAPKQIKAIAQDKQGNIWLGTPGGIIIINDKRQQLAQYDEVNGLVNSFVYSILPGDTGTMWISHNKGLSVFYPRARQFRHYRHEDGLQGNEFNTNAAFRAGDGELFFGGVNGITAFYPKDINDNPMRPLMRITGINLFDEPYVADTVAWNTRLLRLPYNKNVLSFEFAALEYTNAAANIYRYKMEGLDKDWIDAGNKRFARYPNLPSGAYRFMVNGTNNDGLWSESPAALTILIAPPVWQRAWFLALCALVGIGGVWYIVYRIQRQRFRKKLGQIELQQKLQKERERISRDLHDNVGSQISYLVSNIDWITQGKVAEAEKERRLMTIGNAAKGMMNNMRETIWALNKTSITIDEFADKLKTFTLHLQEYNDGVKFRVEEQLSRDAHFEPGEALNIFRICQEAIANAVRHSGATLILLKINTDGASEVAIEIRDNGRGFDVHTAGPKDHYGLQNMQYRATESGVALSITSVVGEGTVVRVVRQ